MINAIEHTYNETAFNDILDLKRKTGLCTIFASVYLLSSNFYEESNYWSKNNYRNNGKL